MPDEGSQEWYRNGDEAGCSQELVTELILAILKEPFYIILFMRGRGI